MMLLSVSAAGRHSTKRSACTRAVSPRGRSGRQSRRGTCLAYIMVHLSVQAAVQAFMPAMEGSSSTSEPHL